MKTLILSTLFICFANIGFAQTKTDKIKVAGECGMCKKKIETAAKTAGASYALWNVETKELTVKYASNTSSLAKIEKAVAETGYDTPSQKATEEAYNKLHECCKYERTAAADEKTVCQHCADGKCTHAKDGKADCCKDGKCSANMDCCKDGKCSHESDAAHMAKSCCKKA